MKSAEKWKISSVEQSVECNASVGHRANNVKSEECEVWVAGYTEWTSEQCRERRVKWKWEQSVECSAKSCKVTECRQHGMWNQCRVKKCKWCKVKSGVVSAGLQHLFNAECAARCVLCATRWRKWRRPLGPNWDDIFLFGIPAAFWSVLSHE